MENQIQDNFIALDSGLWKCKGCGTTFENENECNKHLEHLTNESV